MIIETEVYSCRKCQSEDLVKNGTNASGSSQYDCKSCGAYGVLERTERATEEKKELIIKVWERFTNKLDMFSISEFVKNVGSELNIRGSHLGE